MCQSRAPKGHRCRAGDVIEMFQCFLASRGLIHNKNVAHRCDMENGESEWPRN
jgi:hypothetical protein